MSQAVTAIVTILEAIIKAIKLLVSNPVRENALGYLYVNVSLAASKPPRMGVRRPAQGHSEPRVFRENRTNAMRWLLGSGFLGDEYSALGGGIALDGAAAVDRVEEVGKRLALHPFGSALLF